MGGGGRDREREGGRELVGEGEEVRQAGRKDGRKEGQRDVERQTDRQTDRWMDRQTDSWAKGGWVKERNQRRES